MNISVTLIPDRVDDEAPNRRPSVVVVVLFVSLTRVYNPLEDSGVSLRSRPTAFRPDDTEIPESSDREPWWEYDDELVLDGDVYFDLYSEVYNLGTVVRERLE